MSDKSSARDRAEDLLQSLGRRAREWVDADEGLVQTVRALVEERGLSAADIRRRLDEGLGRLKANKVWERLSQNGKVVNLADYRDELEKRVEEVTSRVVASLPVATRQDLEALAKQVKNLQRKVADLGKKAKKAVDGQATVESEETPSASEG